MSQKDSNVVLNFKMDGQVEYAKTIRDINAIMNAAASEYQTHVAAMGKDAQATQKLSAEKKKLEIQLEAGKKRTEQLRKEYEAMAKDTKTTTGALANKYKQLQNSERAEISLEQALERVNDGLSNQAEESRKAQEALDKLENEASQLESQTDKLNAKYDLQKAQLGDNASESDKLALRMEHLNATHEIAKEKVENYEQQLEQAKKQYGENSTEVDKYEVQLLEARTAEQQLSNEITSTNKQLKAQNDVLAKTSKQLKDTGDKLKGVGKDLSMKVTAPLMGVAAAATKIGMDFEASVSAMGATSGATGADLEELENKAREMGATTNKSAKDAADAMGFMALAGWDNKQMLEGIEPVLKLSSAGNMDLARTSDLVTDSMAALQIEVQDLPGFLDMVAQASRKSNTDMDALMEAFLVAGGTLASFNVPLEESTALLGILANRGLKGSEAGTALNAIFTNLTSGAGQAGKAMEELDISAFDAQGNFKGLEAVLFEVREKILGMTEEQQAQYVTMIAGKEHLKSFQSLMAGLGDEYGALKDDVSNATGVLEEMYEVMTDNLKGQWDEFKSAMEEAGISIFKNLQPALESLLGYLQQGVDWFNNLSPSMQNTIVALGAVVAAIGPLIVVASVLLGSLSTIITTFSAVSTAVAGAGGAMALLTNPIGWVILAIGAAVAAATTLWFKWDEIGEKFGLVGQLFSAFATGPLGMIVAGIKMFQDATSDAIEPIDRFGDSVSESTKEALEGFFELSDGAGQALMELKVTSAKVTDETKDKMVSTFSEMNAQILEGMRENHAEQEASARKHLDLAFSMSVEEREKIVQNLQQKNEREIEIQTAKENIVKEIMESASAERRELTEREKEVINNINEQMKETAVQTLSESEMDQQVILERMKNSAADLTAQQAAEVVRNSAEQRQAVVDEAEAQYDEAIAEIIRMRDESGIITSEQAEEMIGNAERTRDLVVDQAERMHEKVVEEAKLQAEEHVNHVDWETGEILSKWEVFKNNTSEKFEAIKKVLSDKWAEMKEDTANKIKDIITDSAKKFLQLKTDTTKKLEETKTELVNKFTDMVVNTTTKGSEIVTAAKTKFEEVKTAIKTKLVESVTEVATQVGKMPGKVTGKIGEMKQAGKDLISGLIGGIKDMATDAIEAVTGVVDGVITKAKSLLKIASPSKVFIQIGKWISEGWAKGVEMLGGTVVDAVENIAHATMDIAEHYAKEEVKMRNKMNAEIAQIEKRAAEDVAKIQNAARAKKRRTTKEENIRIRRIQEDAAKKIKDLTAKTTKDILNLESKMYKDILSETKLYINDKKSLNELSLADEAHIWEQTLKLFADGTKEKVEVQKEYQKAVEAVNKEVLAIEKEFMGEMEKINKELIKQIDDLRKADEEAINKRTQSLQNFKGIFDSFEWGEGPSGHELLQNLQSQLDGFDLWQKEIEKISSQAIDEGLIAELREMGPKALPELLALNNLTEEELTKYSDMYGEKMQRAREQSEAEHVEMRLKTEDEIAELRKAANKKLNELQKDWTKAIQKINQTTTDEFKSLESIGKKAGQNLLDGLSSMEASLVAKARSIASAVNSAMQGALGGGTSSVSAMSFDTQWNAKGGIFTQPTIFGASGGKLQGAGEAGPEAVLPLNDETLGAIGKGIAKMMGSAPITINSRDDAESIARAVERVKRREAFKMG